MPARHQASPLLRPGSNSARVKVDLRSNNLPGIVEPACCTEEEEAKKPPCPAVDQATQTEFGRAGIRLRTWAGMAASVARALSLWKRSPSPMTCFQRSNWPPTRALSL